MIEIRVNNQLVSGLESTGGCYFLSSEEGLGWKEASASAQIQIQVHKVGTPLLMSSAFMLLESPSNSNVNVRSSLLLHHNGISAKSSNVEDKAHVADGGVVRIHANIVDVFPINLQLCRCIANNEC